MPRFVLVYHECPPDYPRPSHWDLMLEDGGALRTWALAQLPRDWQPLVERSVARADVGHFVAATNTVPAEQLPDHRLAYLDYEGPVSGERGSVTRVESGTYSADEISPERWEVTLAGFFICGRMTIKDKTNTSPEWHLTYQREVGATPVGR